MARSRPAVSVVMPVYNAAPFVREAIESILSQDCSDLELVIVNDGSTDDSAARIRPYLEDRRVRYVEQNNRGGAAAKNRGLELVRGDLVAIQDADDVAARRRIARLRSILHERPAAAFVVSGGYLVDAAGRVLGRTRPARDGLWQQQMRNRMAVAHTTVMFRAGIVRAIGGYDPNFASVHDYELLTRILRAHDATAVSDLLVMIRVHGDQISTRDIEAAALRSLGLVHFARGGLAWPSREKWQEILTRDGLAQVGISVDAIDAKVTQKYVHWAALLGAQHRLQDAKALIERGLSYAVRHRIGADSSARLLAVRGLIVCQDGELWRGCHDLLTAFRRSPLATIRLLISRAQAAGRAAALRLRYRNGVRGFATGSPPSDQATCARAAALRPE